MMRRTAAEKIEIISLVEQSSLSIKQTLKELDVPRSSFYRWYLKYQNEGLDGIIGKSPSDKQIWNKIPDQVRAEVVEMALEKPDLSCRLLAWNFVDKKHYYLSESSIYRILRGYDLIQSPVFRMHSAKQKYEKPTKYVNEMWQTDFTQFKVLNWGWYYLSTVLDDYSRYILGWKLSTTMGEKDVEETLNQALAFTGLTQASVRHRPRLLSDNGPAYLSKDLKVYLKRKNIDHIRGAPYHPMTQGKIERWHRSMKNVVNLQNYFAPSELSAEIANFVAFYNHERYHESLNNLTPTDVYYGKEKEVLSKRNEIKKRTMALRYRQNIKPVPV
jgi:putative transposase